ncbi:MAG: NADH-quinone oxidoreductase subunit J [Chloroflexi bacterium]|nr:NADH-quinone oxidoreductase subunit J [Chloroflexota bacterium]
MVLKVVFLLISLFTVGSAFMVVTHRNLFSSALFLVASFFGVAALYVLLEATFLAVAQVLIYVGAIATLIVFAIMLTRGMMSGRTSPRNDQAVWAGLSSVVLGLVLLYVVVYRVRWPVVEKPVPPDTIERLGSALVGPYVIPFEIASVLLLAALIGAVLIAREREI